MKVAVPLLQHSQWFGHFALSHTVWSRRSARSCRVRVKALVVGNPTFSHAGSRGRAVSETGRSSGLVVEGQALISGPKRPERRRLWQLVFRRRRRSQSALAGSDNYTVPLPGSAECA
jgi:hypothetical protein